MKTIFILFDSLNRRALNFYGGMHIKTPNFDRFAQRSVVFETHYVGSLPCMPARRDMLTGRINFLHRSWGPLEPFDNPYPEILRAANVYTHLISDHYHYWEDGGATYHNRYSSYEFVRGQEWDKWKAMVQPPRAWFSEIYHRLQQPQNQKDGRLQHMINREFIVEEEDFCCPRVLKAAFDFLENNRNSDNWLLQLECFDPHEPFFAPARFRKDYPTPYKGPVLDWPRYQRVMETPYEIAELRANYAASVAMCDFYLGKLLDYLDHNEMWQDTAVILSTDHGCFLGEHGWWMKNRMPFYNELVHIPLMIYHPHFSAKAGHRRTSLTQTIDLMPTILDFYRIEVPKFVEGRSLLPVLESDQSIHEAVLFGMFGGGTNITDGKNTYFRYPHDMTKYELFEYTLMPVHQKAFCGYEELSKATLTNQFMFTRGMPVLKIPALKDVHGRSVGHTGQGGGYEDTVTALFDLETDPGQEKPVIKPEIEKRMIQLMVDLMIHNEAPPEAFLRLGLNPRR